MWNPFKRPVHPVVYCTPETLPLLIRDLNRDSWASEIVTGPHIRIAVTFRDDGSWNSGLYRVTLYPEQAAKLRKGLRSYEFSDVYGPDAVGR